MDASRLFAVSAVAIAALACAEPSAPPLEVAPRFNTTGPFHHVVGSGHVEQAGSLREFTFHAVQQPDGSASGSFKVVLPSGLFFEADVTCVTVDGGTGWVGGVIRATNAGVVIIGSVSTFYAIDGGEGEGSGDIVSTAAFNAAAGADLAFCANQPLALPPLTVSDGNVQVR
jgi:hypothetical protein